MYAPLKDPDVSVRKNALMVLSHLILNDMIKVKGEISGVAVCLEDDEAPIVDLAKLFFTELARKCNLLNGFRSCSFTD
jgi:condensin complex subunit 1